ncbi:protein LEAD-SENSITIVE 1-like [Rutidosis leptorrhynchoides]|uniref:protein LEAD-SENSITIVE 1-like n=1 Tax=Rutidosis leptorrhynchoides TaxID=125765 RepID=UPI003A999B95
MDPSLQSKAIVGENVIIHFVCTNSAGGSSTVLPGFSFSSSATNSTKSNSCPLSYCGLEKVTGSGVRMSCIDCFIKNGSLYLFKYEASREFLLSKLRGGTCTTATSDPVEQVIRRATYLFENGYKEYHLLTNNCEDFSLYCKTGLWSTDINKQGRSSQANMVRHGEDDEHEHKSGKILKKVTNAIPKYCLKRMNYDLGNRLDLVKVDVIELLSFICSQK